MLQALELEFDGHLGRVLDLKPAVPSRPTDRLVRHVHAVISAQDDQLIWCPHQTDGRPETTRMSVIGTSASRCALHTHLHRAMGWTCTRMPYSLDMRFAGMPTTPKAGDQVDFAFLFASRGMHCTLGLTCPGLRRTSA